MPLLKTFHNMCPPSSFRLVLPLKRGPSLSISTLSRNLTFVFLSVVFLIPIHALAANLRGTIRLDALKKIAYVISDSELEIYRVDALTRSAREGLSKLKDGDFISATGALNSNQRRMDLHSIESVGLKNLLGLWQASDSSLYEFLDFGRLNQYTLESSLSGGLTIKKAQELTYVLTPDRGDRFSIFLSGKSDIRVGTLETSGTDLRITVFDSKTGLVTENISLSPIPLK